MDLQYLTRNAPLPEWAKPGTRYRQQWINEMVLRGKLYDHIPHAFCEEYDQSRRFISRHDRRPSIRLHLPILAVNMVSRKLFAGRHQPNIVHDKDNVLKSVNWFVKESKLFTRMLDIAYWAGGGSVGITLSVANGKPVITIWQSRYCTPYFDEAEELAEMYVSLCVDGPQLLDMGMRLDVDGDKITEDGKYWYIRVWNREGISTMAAIKDCDWNPECPNREKERVWMHQLLPFEGMLAACWIKNLPGGDPQGCDGRAIFSDALDNCINLDYTASTIGRGVDYSANPQLMVKGKVLNLDRSTGQHVMGPSRMLQLPADRKDGEQSVTGADAKIIEMDANGLSVGMEKFFERMKMFTHELMSTSRKDPNTISGVMSGKAMELVDDDVVDLAQVCRTTLGDEGELEIIKVGCKMCIMLGHPKFAGVSVEDIDLLENDWPKLFTPSPQELAFLVQAISGAIEWGMIDQPEGRNWLEIQADQRSLTIDKKAHAYGDKPPPVKKTEPNVEKPEPKSGGSKKPTS